jgi:hypothetical protein
MVLPVGEALQEVRAAVNTVVAEAIIAQLVAVEMSVQQLLNHGMETCRLIPDSHIC